MLLDLLMPDMDGFQVIEKLKNDPQTEKIPIIVTSITNEQCEEQAFAAGASDFISKPYRPFIVRNRVANVVSSVRYGEELKQKDDNNQTEKE